MDELKSIIQKHGKSVYVYVGKETTTDAYEGEVSITYYQPVVIKGLLEDMSDAKAIYSMPGIQTDKRKIFVTHKNNRSLIESSHKILIDNEIYYGFRDGNGSNIRIKEEGNFIRIFLARKLYA